MVKKIVVCKNKNEKYIILFLKFNFLKIFKNKKKSLSLAKSFCKKHNFFCRF